MMLQNKGFTLIEILIALFIFAIIAMVVAAGLGEVLKAQQIYQEHEQELQALQTTFLLFERDIQQMIDRPIMRGQMQQDPSLFATINPYTYLEFTRMGFINPGAMLIRSHLVRVAYACQNNTLWRMVWPTLDRAQDTVLSARILLNHVSDCRFSYYDDKLKSQLTWPPPTNKLNQDPLPHAITLHFCLTDLGCTNLTIAVPAGSMHGQH